MKRLGWIIVGGSFAVIVALLVPALLGRHGPAPTTMLRQQLYGLQNACEVYYMAFATYPPSNQGGASLHEYLVGPTGVVGSGLYYCPHAGEVTTRPSGARTLVDRVYGHEILYYRGTGNAAPSVIFGTASNALYVEADNPVTPSTIARPEFWSFFGTTSNTIPPTWAAPGFTRGLLISAGKDGMYFTHDDVIRTW